MIPLFHLLFLLSQVEEADRKRQEMEEKRRKEEEQRRREQKKREEEVCDQQITLVHVQQFCFQISIEV